MITRICSRCGERVDTEHHRTHMLIMCMHCGYTEENWQSGYDDGDEPYASTVDDDEDEDEDDEDYVPTEWWEDEDE